MNMTRFLSLFALLVASFTVACGGAQTDATTANEHDESGASDTEGEASAHDEGHDGQVHWGYAGEIGPEHWGSLADDFSTCGSGQSQSPIDLPGEGTTELADLSFEYTSSALRVINNGHTIQSNIDPGSFLVIDGERYQLLQFHFHAGSEHTVAGEQYPFEVHLVHQNEAGQLAVVGVFFEVGEENAALTPIWEAIPTTVGEENHVDGVTHEASALLPTARTGWSYSGSLTTPPCSEGVSWSVMSEPLQISQEQLDAFRALHDGNFRPVQPLNERSF